MTENNAEASPSKTSKDERQEEQRREKLSKTLSYILRYGAECEGLTVYKNGHVRLADLLQLSLLSYYSETEILNELTTSISTRGIIRYEMSESVDGVMMVRATYGRRMMRPPTHEGSNVMRLMELALTKVANNTNLYDLEEFYDNHLLNVIMLKMKRKGQLTGKTLKTFLVPGLTHVDLWNVYVSEGTIRYMANNCPNLQSAIFRDAGYVMNDQLLSYFLKRTPKLLSLNLCGCHHITQQSLQTIPKHCPHMVHLNLTFLKCITDELILLLAQRLINLEEINIYTYKGPSNDNLNRLLELTKDRRFRLETATYKMDDCYDSAWEHPNYRQ